MWQQSADNSLTVGKRELFNLLSIWRKLFQAAQRQKIIYKIQGVAE